MEEIDISDQKLNKKEKGSKCIGSMQFHGNSCRQSINLWSRDRKKNQTSLISLYPRRKKGIWESDRIRSDILTKQI